MPASHVEFGNRYITIANAHQRATAPRAMRRSHPFLFLVVHDHFTGDLRRRPSSGAAIGCVRGTNLEDRRARVSRTRGAALI
jgi:hypothetical protein